MSSSCALGAVASASVCPERQGVIVDGGLIDRAKTRDDGMTEKRASVG